MQVTATWAQGREKPTHTGVDTRRQADTVQGHRGTNTPCSRKPWAQRHVCVCVEQWGGGVQGQSREMWEAQQQESGQAEKG